MSTATAGPTRIRPSVEGHRQVDGYQAYERVAATREKLGALVILVYCWAHTRRKFTDIHKRTSSSIAAEVLQWIAALSVIEAEIRGQPPDQRAVRQAKSRPIVEALKAYLDDQSQRVEDVKATELEWLLPWSWQTERLTAETDDTETVAQPLAA